MKSSNKVYFLLLFLLSFLPGNSAFAGVGQVPSSSSSSSEKNVDAEIGKHISAEVFFIEAGEQFLISGTNNFFKPKNKSQSWIFVPESLAIEEKKEYFISSRFIELRLNISNLIFPFHYFW